MPEVQGEGEAENRRRGWDYLQGIGVLRHGLSERRVQEGCESRRGCAEKGLMSIKVKCVRCGAANELNRVFCSKCGGKLDLSNVSTGERSRSARLVSGLVRLVVSFLILAIAGLMLWPVEPSGALGSAADVRAMTGTLQFFQQAIQNRAVVDRVITEAQVNGYLDEVLRQNREALRSEGFRLGIREINVSFTREDFIVLVLANWGPISLSYEIKAVPLVKSGRFEVVVKRARWGHLPLPEPAAAWISKRVAGMFLRMEKELAILNSLGRCDLGNGRVYVATRGT